MDRKWAPILVAISIVMLPQAAAADELHIASWNVENLFDTADDPEVEDDEDFTPTAAKGWTEMRLKRKVENLAKVIIKMNQDKGPDVLGLCEIENRAVVKMLVKELATLERDYRIVHQDSPSDRGIDCAILYDAKKIKLLRSEFTFVEADKTRDITGAEFAIGAKRLHVFMNHWPSRNNDASQRIAAAKTLRGRVDALLKVDAAADIVILGDLNDTPDNVSVRDHLRAKKGPAKLNEGDLLNTMGPVMAAEKGTYVFDDAWQVIDHVIVSQGLLNAAGFEWKSGSTATVEFPFQIFTPKKGIPRPNRTYAGNNYHADGISDHLPVQCILKF